MMLFQFLSFLSYVLFVCSVPSFHHRTLIFHCPYKQLNFWRALAMHRMKFAENLFHGCSSSSCCSEPSHLQHFTFSVPAFSSWDLLHFACLLIFQPLKYDSGEKFTTLWSQVANHPTIAFKIFFIFPYDLEKVGEKYRLLAKDNEKESIFVKLIYL